MMPNITKEDMSRRLEQHNGRDFITNFGVERCPLYKRAILLYKEKTGDDSLYIKDDAFDVDGNNVTNYLSLHCRYKQCKELSLLELSLFWEIYDSIKEEDK